MVKLYASLLALTLAANSALAYPITEIVVRQRDLDQEFLGREYLLDTRDIYQDDLEGRSIFSLLGALGKAGGGLGRLTGQVGKLAGKTNKVRDGVKQIQRPRNSNRHAPRFRQSIVGPVRHQRRDLEDDAEELLQRDFEDEELFGREYDELLVERDAAFDDLD